jgi:hypothetical protein
VLKKMCIKYVANAKGKVFLCLKAPVGHLRHISVRRLYEGGKVLTMKKGLLVILCAWLAVLAWGAPVDSATISRVATAYFVRYVRPQHVPGVISVRPVSLQGAQAHLALVRFSPKGWMLLATDDRMQPVYGFDGSSEFDESAFAQNTGLEFLGQTIERQFRKLDERTVQTPDTRWASLPALRSTSALNDVSPLVPVLWNQGSGWNARCPEDPAGPGGRVWVGCVAVAMGQAMTAFRKPSSGVGSFSYYHPTYHRQSVDFNAYGTYDWSKLVDGTNTPNAVIADFLYHCAVSVSMDFGTDGSGAFVSDAATALARNFRFNSTVKEVKRFASDTAWIDLLVKELQQGRPVIYGGDAGDGKAGHAFNIDGYNASSGFFHLNWGWSGSANGYYSINLLTPGGNDFTQNQSAIVGMVPSVPGPKDVSLTSNTLRAGMPAGTPVGSFVVTDDYAANTYTYTLSGYLNIFDDYDPLNFTQENGVLKSTKTFTYTQGFPNKDYFHVKVQDAFGNKLEKDLSVSILQEVSVEPATATPSSGGWYDASSGVLYLKAQQPLSLRVVSADGREWLSVKALKGTSVSTGRLPRGICIALVGTSTGNDAFTFVVP